MPLGLVQGGNFEVFLTCDSNLEYQQNLSGRVFAVVVLRVPNKRMDTLLPLVPSLLTLLPTVRPGHLYHVSLPAPEPA